MTAESHGSYESPEMPDLDESDAASDRSRRGTSIAWLAWLAAIVPTVGGLVLLGLTWDAKIPDSYGFRGFTALFSVTFGTLGAIVLARQPGNRIGWVFAVGAIESGVQIFATEYATYGLLIHPGSLPWAQLAAWSIAWVWLIGVILVGPVLFLVFPDGRTMTPRWRWVLRAAVTGGVLYGIQLAFRPGPLENAVYAVNPFGLGPSDALASFGQVGQILILGTLLAGIGSLVLRYRRAGPTGRLQLRWVAYAAMVLAISGPLGFSGQKYGEVAFIVNLTCIPVAAGIAVLRYRLYDIDLLINRTIVYGLLTAVLAGIYAGTVALLQRFFVVLTGGTSDAAIVLSTIVVVSVFTPFRARLQRVVDRRFREVRDPRAPLAEFVAAIETRIWRLDPEAALQHMADVTAAALGASSASITRGGEPVARVGVGDFEPALLATSGEGAARLAIAVGPRTEGAPFTERDRVAAQSAVAALADALARQA